MYMWGVVCVVCVVHVFVPLYVCMCVECMVCGVYVCVFYVYVCNVCICMLHMYVWVCVWYGVCVCW